MFENVLVGVDGRPNGRDAIELARKLIDADSRLTLAHVRDGWAHPLHAVAPDEQQRTASEQLLERERAEARVEAALVSVAATSPRRGLHEQAQELGADLLVVGSTSRGPLGRAMLGDDTRGALNGAPCAVAIACRGYEEHPFPVARIGVAYNGSPESERALETAHAIAASTRADLVALDTVKTPDSGRKTLISYVVEAGKPLPVPA